ncbi:MBL fold metallo-hydrolase [Paraflavisolibacter sp. H34]|uniref:MBL fold metallo-hydrolase n=1 Tax=Huijunlia imazamoxiresistens TaxID=3127457 RepID=UPI0030182868
MNQYLVDQRQVSATEERELSENVFLVAPGVWRMKDLFVNVFIIQNREGTNWILVDAGLKSSAAKIKRMVADVLTAGSTPSSIIMTHGHFDHRGSLQQLADEWRVPVYAHHLEMPYLTGRASYPPPDPTVGGGAMSVLSFTYPRGPINAQDHMQDLPENGKVPGMSEWRWIHTPGHSPGHISLFRDRDGVLIAGDAVVTTQQESVFSVMAQKKKMCGPPKYFTPDWGAAARSVKELAALEPNIVASGHGHSIYGDQARKSLHKLARQFWKSGMPEKGRYVKEPALFGEDGPTYIPKMRINYKKLALAGLAATAVVAGLVLYRQGQLSGWRGQVAKLQGQLSRLQKQLPKFKRRLS